MGRKTNKQKIKERKEELLTVAQMIELLKEFPQDAHIGVIGHFGEFYGLDKYDFHYGCNAYLTPDGFWRNEDREYMTVVTVHTADIGPDPD